MPQICNLLVDRSLKRYKVKIPVDTGEGSGVIWESRIGIYTLNCAVLCLILHCV